MVRSETGRPSDHRRPVRRRVGTAVALLASLALMAMLAVRAKLPVRVEPNLRIDSFRVIDVQTITVTVAVDGGSWTRVTSLSEAPTTMRVTIESLEWPLPLPGTHDLVLRELSIRLSEDLGTRKIEDAAGNAVPMR